MMKKEWYIFQGTQHRGPFSKNDLLEFYKDGSLKRESLVWREEASEWEPLHKISELSFILESNQTNVDFPDLEISNEEITHEVPSPFQVDELPPPLPPLPEFESKPRARKKILAKVPETFKDPTRLDLPPVPELLEILKDEEKLMTYAKAMEIVEVYNKKVKAFDIVVTCVN